MRNTRGLKAIVTIHFHCMEKAAQNLTINNSVEFHERKRVIQVLKVMRVSN